MILSNWIVGPALGAATLASLTMLAPYLPISPHVEFRGQPLAEPAGVRAGGTVTAIYEVRRNRSCPPGQALRETRWFRANHDGLIADPDHVDTTHLVQAPETNEFQLFRITLAVPDDLAPGEWIYWPLLSCGADVQSAPPLRVTVLPPE